MFNVKKIVSTLSKNAGLIRCAIYNMADNGKAPDSRTGIVLKSGAKVERISRYAISAKCAKWNSAENKKGQTFRNAPLYQYLRLKNFFPYAK